MFMPNEEPNHTIIPQVSTTLQSVSNAKLSQQRFLVMPEEQANQDDSNDTPQPVGECQVSFPLLWIKDYPGLS